MLHWEESCVISWILKHAFTCWILFNNAECRNYHCHLNVLWKTGTYIYLYNAALVVIVALTASWFKRSVLVMHLIANKARVLINLYCEDRAVARFVGWFQVPIIVLSLALILVLKLLCYVYSLYMFCLLLLKDEKTVQLFFITSILCWSKWDMHAYRCVFVYIFYIKMYV